MYLIFKVKEIFLYKRNVFRKLFVLFLIKIKNFFNQELTVSRVVEYEGNSGVREWGGC